MQNVEQFKDEFSFLSNFHPCCIKYNGVDWLSSEHLYQALKFDDPAIQNQIREHEFKGLKKFAHSISADFLKQEVFAGRNANGDIVLSRTWRIDVMKEVLTAKFIQHSDLLAKLRKIDGNITEGNHWHDNFFGACYCDKCRNEPKNNHLGKLLMFVRDNLFPEHEKLLIRKQEHSAITSFCEFLSGHKYRSIAKWNGLDLIGTCSDAEIASLIAEYFGIDIEIYHKENDHILQVMKRMNNGISDMEK